jgi:hypothetical protein
MNAYEIQDKRSNIMVLDIWTVFGFDSVREFNSVGENYFGFCSASFV